MKNEYSFKVAWGDTDAAGIVFYPNFYRWMDQAAHELFSVAGLSMAKLQKEEHIALPLLEAFCQFKAPLTYDEQVIVRSEILEVKQKVVKISHKFYKQETIAAEGYEVRAWVSVEETPPRAIVVPEHIKRILLSN